MAKSKVSIEDRKNFDLNLIQGYEWIIGIDEVGWGCIAGDLYLGAVAIHRDLLNNWTEFCKRNPELEKIRDSKKLSHEQRQLIFSKAKELNDPFLKIVYGIGSLSLINSKGLAPAFDYALESIFTQLESESIDLSKVKFLMDGKRVPKPLLKFTTELIITGDDKSLAIGFASIMAKETRDTYMNSLHDKLPAYNWLSNKGYGTAEHTLAVKTHGISEYHRKNSTEKIIS